MRRAPLINPPPPQPTKTIPAQILLCMFYSGRRRFVLCARAAVVNKFIKVTYGVNLLYGGFFGPCLLSVKENERRRERAKAAPGSSSAEIFAAANLHKIISSNALGMRIMCCMAPPPWAGYNKRPLCNWLWQAPAQLSLILIRRCDALSATFLTACVISDASVGIKEHTLKFHETLFTN